MGPKTRVVQVKHLKIGGGNPDQRAEHVRHADNGFESNSGQIELLKKAGADIIRIAADNDRDVAALKEIRSKTDALLSVDLQENYLLASTIAPFVDKIRYNPGHLHHLNKDIPIEKKVAWLADVAKKHGCAVRIGVNCGSVAPDFMKRFPEDREHAMIESAVWHCEIMDGLGFQNYLVSLKDSDPFRVIRTNEEFAKRRPDVPLHLGVTEAGMPPEGVIKTRIAFEKLIAQGIGDTVRVSLTVPFEKKDEEIFAARQILKDIADGKFITVPANYGKGLNIISCPSCSRVENRAFIELAEKVRETTAFARDHKLTIAVMGCRVNGPGETDDADLGLWCGPKTVTLKKKSQVLGTYRYDNVLSVLKENIEAIIRPA